MASARVFCPYTLGRTTVIFGSPGAGKTVFALQSLVNGIIRWDEPGIFVSFEENSQKIIENAGSFDWKLPAAESSKLFFIDARLAPDTIRAGGFDLNGLLATVGAQAKAMGAKRIVFDSMDVLLSTLDDRQAERQEMYRLQDWLAATRLTGIITAQSGSDEMEAVHRYSFLQFLADCTIHLRHVLTEHVSLRALQITKYRGSSFAENEVPMVIGPEGIEVAVPRLHEVKYEVSTERVSTGVERLDTMLEGGYFRGSSTLITGAPGTAKSTLSAAFALASCRREERTLYVSFDEGENDILRNMTSVGMNLQPFVESGLLRMYSSQTEARSADEHLLRLKALIRDYAPRSLVIDPLSAILKSGGLLTALAVVQQLLHITKMAGITVVWTSLLESNDTSIESSPMRVSTIADTWMHLSYITRGGERNRALSIVKSRGTEHSNQVRELILSKQGITLADVYTADGEVLMGTLRYEKELAEELEKERTEAILAQERQDVARDEAETNARIEALKRELEVRQAALHVLEVSEKLRGLHRHTGRQAIQQMRGADALPDPSTPSLPPYVPEIGS